MPEDDFVRLTYRSDLNRLRCAPRVIEFYDSLANGKLVKLLREVVKGVYSDSDNGVHLEVFFCSGYCARTFSDHISVQNTLAFYPKEGSVNYELREDVDFLSDIHKNPDPIFITDVTPRISLSDKTSDEIIRFRGRGGGSATLNYITSYYLFKNNPFVPEDRYDGFAQMFEEGWDKDEWGD